MNDKTNNKKIPCEVYSRVVGYLRPVGNWHAAKQAEFKERVVFDADVPDEDIVEE